ncbi:MAG: 6-carboxytetrahydropterin synthase QueD [Bacillota bacterium]
MYELTVETSFAAAHCLKGHDSPCGRLHGHNWTVAVTVSGDELSPSGMLLDFTVLKEVVRDAVAVFDHRYLNETLPFSDGDQPTAENIARSISEAVAGRLSAYPNVRIKEVRVAESPTAWVVYKP